MTNQDHFTAASSITQTQLERRRFLSRAGLLSLGAAATTVAFAGSTSIFAESAAERAQERQQSKDTVKEIFTAALIAEDLATTFYYNGLIGPVIQDVNLAGPGGTATSVTTSGNAGFRKRGEC